MLIHLPISEVYHSIKLFVSLPDGYDDYTMQVNVADGITNMVVPEGVSEDDIEVTASFTDHTSKCISEYIVLKTRVEPESKVNDESDSDEAVPFLALKTDLEEDQEEDFGGVDEDEPEDEDDPWDDE